MHPRMTLPENRIQVYDTVFTTDSKTLIAADREGAIILWDVENAPDGASH
jgi:hypothetical protein